MDHSSEVTVILITFPARAKVGEVEACQIVTFIFVFLSTAIFDVVPLSEANLLFDSSRFEF